MSNLLRLADYRQQIEQQQVEVRKVSLDDGYTQIANELLLAIAKFGFTQRQRAVLDAVILKTYRFHKKTDWISNSQICELTGISHECKISTAKQELIRMNVLVQKGREIGINPVITEWVKEDLPKKENIYQNGKKTFIETVKEDLPKKENTKETITKNNKNTPLTPQGENLPVGKSKSKRLAEKIDYQAIADAWNQANENSGSRLPFVEKVNDGRKRTIKKFLGELKEPTVSCAGNYFRAFFNSATPHHFGENDRGWKASFDFAIRPDVVLRVREGAL
nr:MAG TPA: replication protein O [Caudoviricetes sp.]